MASGQIGIKLGTKCYIPNFSKFYVQKRYLYYQASKCHLWHENTYFTDHNITQNGAWN